MGFQAVELWTGGYAHASGYEQVAARLRELEEAIDAGRRARLVLREPVGNDRVLEGRLAGFEGGQVRLDMGEAGVKEFDLSNISKAQLVVETLK